MIDNGLAPPTPAADIYTDLNSLQNIKGLEHHDHNAALKAVAHQFEAVMVQMMMKSMRQANAVFADDDPLNSHEMQMYQDMFDNQLSLTLAQGRGMGIAEALMRQFQARAGGAADAGAHAAGTVAGATAAHGALLRQARAALQNTDIAKAVGSGAGGEFNAADDTYEQLLAMMTPPTRSAPVDPASLDGTPSQFIETLGPVAEQVASRLGVDSRVLLSQAALETGWGEKMVRYPDGRPSYNFFNIKAGDDWHGAVVNVPTVEYRSGVAVRETAAFRAYASPEASFADYAHLIANNPRYKQALDNADDPAAYMHALQRAGYATDPRYAQKVLSVYASDPVQQTAPATSLALANPAQDAADPR